LRARHLKIFISDLAKI